MSEPLTKPSPEAVPPDTSESTESIAAFLAPFEDFLHRLPSRASEWLTTARRANLARFATLGWPTPRDEDWKYTPITAITKHPFAIAGPRIPRPITLPPIPELDCDRVVIVDGSVDLAQSTLGVRAAVQVKSLAVMMRDEAAYLQPLLGSVQPPAPHGFTALNNAYYHDGVVVLLAAGARLAKPLELVFVSDAGSDSASDAVGDVATMACPRNLVVAGPDSQATIIVRHVCADDRTSQHPTLTNSTTELIVQAHAAIDYYLLQTQSPTAYYVGGIWARQAAHSRLRCYSMTSGGALVRNDLHVTLAAPDAHCTMLGAYCLRGRQHVDNHTNIVHAAARCSSREWYKGVLDQRARGVFHGRIKVAEGAQQTAAEQTNNTLLLSAHAEIDTQPQLEIYADEVQCSHGATIGQLDETALFYLRARGLDPDLARRVLVEAFVAEILEQVELAPLRDYLTAEFATQVE